MGEIKYPCSHDELNVLNDWNNLNVFAQGGKPWSK